MIPRSKMMKWRLVISACLFTLPVFSQVDTLGFWAIDRGISGIQSSAPAVLAKELTGHCTTDLQKVRAIFRWIADNIAYRTRELPMRGKKNKKGRAEEEDDDSDLKPLDERVAESVLTNGVAVCDGYARLFKTLCSYAGIRAEVINGYGKTEPGKAHQRFRSNHSWNAVYIDSTWQLLDVTWASGYITWSGNSFVRQLDEQYFLSPPGMFIREHYPDDLRWALMDDPPLMPEFRFSPFRQKSFVKYRINSISPSTGVIEAALGDTIRVELHTTDYFNDRNISSDPFLDLNMYNTETAALLQPPAGPITATTSYTYFVNSPTVKWLYVLYNDDVILRYKLSIRKDRAAVNGSASN